MKREDTSLSVLSALATLIMSLALGGGSSLDESLYAICCINSAISSLFALYLSKKLMQQTIIYQKDLEKFNLNDQRTYVPFFECICFRSGRINQKATPRLGCQG